MHQFFINVIQGMRHEIEDEKDSADLIQVVVIIAGFAVVAIGVIGWVSTALFGVGADTSKCITEYGEGIFSNRDTRCFDGVRFNSSGTTNIDQAECAIESSSAYRSRFADGSQVGCGRENKIRE